MSENCQIEPIYFKLHLKILLYLGIDIIPIENPIFSIIFLCYSIFIIGLMCCYTILEFMDMVLNFENFNKMTFILCYFVTHILGTAKMFLMLALRKKLWHHFQTLENGVFKPNFQRGGNDEFTIITNAIKMSNRQVYFFYVFVIIIIGARSIFAATANLPYDKINYFDGNETVIINTKIMPYTTWTPFDYNASPYYELVFAFQIFCTVIYGFYIGATDGLIWGFMMLIKAQFLIVKRALDTLIERSAPSYNNTKMKQLEESSQHNAKRHANDCIQHHQELINFCNLAENDFCYLMLLQFLSSLLILCFQLYQLSTLSPGTIEFFSMSMYLILMTFQLLCYCWHGNELAIVSGQVSAYVYNINWLILNNSINKSLLLIMMRSQRPNFFTAGKFSILSLQTFMTIMRGAASYFMFLRQINA